MTYVNDKPTGALIGRQAFGGGRASGTNDKVGSPLALQRWVNARFVKENFAPAHDWTYPYMGRIEPATHRGTPSSGPAWPAPPPRGASPAADTR